MRLLREARSRGVKISGEVCPHHIALTDEAVQNFDTNFKMNPPLRSAARMSRRCWAASLTARSSILASDHAPHAGFEKEVEFDQAPFGIVGLETELGLFLDHACPPAQDDRSAAVIEMYTVEPARLLEAEERERSRPARAAMSR